MSRTLTKQPNNRKEWVVPPSPRSLEVMYQYSKTQQDILKNDVFEFFKRLMAHCNKEFLSKLILEEDPLLNIYDMFLEANKTFNVPVIVLSDTNADASASKASANVDGNATQGEWMLLWLRSFFDEFGVCLKLFFYFDLEVL
ncbi:hypothetical protein OROMI_000035 [Orobanche minor]